MTFRICQSLGRFQHRVFIQITGRHPRRLFVRIWEYPPLKLAMQEAGFEKVEAYVHSPHKFSSVFQSMDIIFQQRLWYVYMGEYQLRYAHLYFQLLRFSVLVIIRQYKNGSSYKNMKSYPNIFLPFCILWISFSHRYFDICILVNIGLDMLIYISNYSDSLFWL